MTEQSRFFLKNLTTGILWLLAIVVIFVLAINLIGEVHYEKYLITIYDKPFWFYMIFVISEVFFGIIPPEIFMLINAQKEDVSFYIFSIVLLSGISYGAGVLGYIIGNLLNTTRLYRHIHNRFLEKYMVYLKKFSGFLIIVASLTPVPFSAIAMLVGASGYPFRKYLLFSLFRFLRFVVYSILIYRTSLFSQELF